MDSSSCLTFSCTVISSVMYMYSVSTQQVWVKNGSSINGGQQH